MHIRISMAQEHDRSALVELRQWLSDEPELRGRVTEVTEPGRDGYLGGLVEALVVATASINVLAALVQLSLTWLEVTKQRRKGNLTSSIKVAVTEGDKTVEVTLTGTEDPDAVAQHLTIVDSK